MNAMLRPFSTAPAPLTVRVASVSQVAEGVMSIELQPVTGDSLPEFSAGSHVDLHLPDAAVGGLIRQYSICSDPADVTRYELAVALEPASRGGSRYVHEQLKAGQVVEIGWPRNNFPLAEDAAHSILVAGGIGMTPLLAMARRLSALRRKWTLYLCARTPARAVFIQEAMCLPYGQVVPVYDGIPGVASLDLQRVVAAAEPDTHFYCCGPKPLMEAFGRATAALQPSRVHTEWFAAPSTPTVTAAGKGSFQVRLQKSGKVFRVSEDESLLDALTRCGISVASSCRDGICGTCEVRVLSGTPDHRDYVLSTEESAKGDRMFACVSRCRDEELVLDL
jgi:ferredoxin-NADP reductase